MGHVWGKLRSQNVEIGTLSPPSITKPTCVDVQQFDWQFNPAAPFNILTRPLLRSRSRKSIDTGKFSQQSWFRKQLWHGLTWNCIYLVLGGGLAGQGHIPWRIMAIGGMWSKIQWSLKAAPGLHHSDANHHPSTKLWRHHWTFFHETGKTWYIDFWLWKYFALHRNKYWLWLVIDRRRR